MSSKLCAVALVSLLVGCGGAKPRPDDLPRAGDPLAAWVPADSPYVFGAVERAPEGTWSRELTRIAPATERLLNAVDAVAGQLGPEALGFELQAVLGLLGELRGRMSPQGLTQLGIDLEAPMLIYGVGLMPAIRGRLASGERFRATLDRVFAHLRLTPQTLDHHGVRAQVVDLLGGELQLVVAVQGDELATALFTPGTRDLVLDAVLLGRLGGPSLATTGALERLARAYDVRAWGLGYLDHLRLLEALTPAATGLNGRVAAALGAPELPPGCLPEVRRLVEAAPRLAFGARAVDARRSHWVAQLELASDVAAMLANARATVPGLGADLHRGSFATFGVAIDLQKLAFDLLERLGELRTQPYTCESLQALNPLAENAVAFRETLAAYPALHGFDLAISTLRMDDGVPQVVQGTVVVASPQAAQLVDIAATLLPAVAELGLRPDARPVRLPLADFGVPDLGDLWVALTQSALGAAFGGATPESLTRVLTAPPAPTAPMIFARLDRAAFERLDTEETIAGIALMAGEGDDPAVAELIAALRAFGEAVASQYGELTVSGAPTPTGLAFEIQQALVP